MIEAIALLRKAADDCAARADKADVRETRTELFDIAARCHWLAGEAAQLCKRTKELVDDPPACSTCSTKCGG